MTRRITLAHLTAIDLAPPALIRMAARLGYDGVGLRLVPVTPDGPGYSLRDPALLRETRDALAETGLVVADVEFVRITPAFDPCGWEPFLATGAELGAAHVICAPYDPDRSRLADTLAAFAVRCAAHGLRPALEFFPWTPVADLAGARAVVEAAGCPDVGILVDALHFDRSDSRLADLAAMPPDRLPFAHLCDAPALWSPDDTALLHTARAERLAPGAGGIDLASLLRALPPALPLALEVPMAARASREGSDVAAREAIAGMRAVLDASGG